ncbi:hypothetical protein TNCV_4684491 [Trichonephila clavipes]|nr:hypothetical protein TNCV_4684491 [Trichonephila clavipes]
MPQKRKSGLSKNSSRARAAKIARNQESSVHAELRRQQQAQRQSILCLAECVIDNGQKIIIVAVYITPNKKLDDIIEFLHLDHYYHTHQEVLL